MPSDSLRNTSVAFTVNLRSLLLRGSSIILLALLRYFGGSNYEFAFLCDKFVVPSIDNVSYGIASIFVDLNFNFRSVACMFRDDLSSVHACFVFSCNCSDLFTIRILTGNPANLE